MKKRIFATGVTLALASSLVAPAAMASTDLGESTGTMSLAAVLTADGNQFDSNWYDYDITVNKDEVIVRDRKTGKEFRAWGSMSKFNCITT